MTKEKNLVLVPAKDGKPAYWQTEITLGYRRVRRFAGHTKEEARAFLAELRVANKEKRLAEVLKPLTAAGDKFGSYARTLLDSAEWKAKRSASRDEISLKNLNHTFKEVLLADVNPGLVRRYVTRRTEDGMSPATINRELSFLKSVLYAAEFDNLIASNPIRGRRVKKLDEDNNREKKILDLGLTDDDFRRLVDGAADYLKSILKLALTSGMREGEILKLGWKDVDFRHGSIRVRTANAKTKRERFIPFDSILYAELDAQPRTCDIVFANPDTGKVRTDLRKAFWSACKAAGIPTGREKGIVFHDLRHVAAYHLVKATDVVTASKILGHASIQMTMRYVHPTEADKRQAVEKVSESLFGGRQKDVNASAESAGEAFAEARLLS